MWLFFGYRSYIVCLFFALAMADALLSSFFLHHVGCLVWVFHCYCSFATLSCSCILFISFNLGLIYFQVNTACFYTHDLGQKTGLVNLSVKRMWEVFNTYSGFVHHNFVCFFISATWMHPSSYLRNGCPLSSKVGDGENCCFRSIYSAANWTCCWPSCCSCPLSYKRAGLPGMSWGPGSFIQYTA